MADLETIGAHLNEASFNVSQGNQRATESAQSVTSLGEILGGLSDSINHLSGVIAADDGLRGAIRRTIKPANEALFFCYKPAAHHLAEAAGPAAAHNQHVITATDMLTQAIETTTDSAQSINGLSLAVEGLQAALAEARRRIADMEGICQQIQHNSDVASSAGEIVIKEIAGYCQNIGVEPEFS